MNESSASVLEAQPLPADAGLAPSSSDTPQVQPLGRVFSRFATALGLSEFANQMVMFAVPLYVLRTTGNPAAMGGALALAMIPFVLTQPVSGMIADRCSKRWILAAMNLAMAVVVAGYAIARGSFDVVHAALAAMFLMYAVEGLGAAASEAAVPALVAEDAMVRANSVSFVLSLVSAAGAPLLAGVLLPAWGLTAVLVVSASLFLVASVIKWNCRIPYTRQALTESILRTASRDMREAARFLCRENLTIGRIVIVVALVNATVTSLVLVGLPTLATLHFGHGETATGLVAALAMLGGTAGAAAMGHLEGRVTLGRAWWVLAGAAVVVAAGGAALWLGAGTAAFVAVVGAFVLAMAAGVGTEVLWWAHIGTHTPEHLVGKVMAGAMAVMIGGVAAGNWLIGRLFARFDDAPHLALVVVAAAIAVVALAARVRPAAAAPAAPSRTGVAQ